MGYHKFITRYNYHTLTYTTMAVAGVETLLEEGYTLRVYGYEGNFENFHPEDTRFETAEEAEAVFNWLRDFQEYISQREENINTLILEFTRGRDSEGKYKDVSDEDILFEFYELYENYVGKADIYIKTIHIMKIFYSPAAIQIHPILQKAFYDY